MGGESYTKINSSRYYISGVNGSEVVGRTIDIDGFLAEKVLVGEIKRSDVVKQVRIVGKFPTGSGVYMLTYSVEASAYVNMDNTEYQISYYGTSTMPLDIYENRIQKSAFEYFEVKNWNVTSPTTVAYYSLQYNVGGADNKFLKGSMRINLKTLAFPKGYSYI